MFIYCLFKGIHNEKEISGLVLGRCEQSSKDTLFQVEPYFYGDEKYILEYNGFNKKADLS